MQSCTLIVAHFSLKTTDRIKFILTVILTYTVMRLYVEVRLLPRKSVKHEFGGQMFVSSGNQLVEDVEVSFSLWVRCHAGLLQQVGLERGRERERGREGRRKERRDGERENEGGREREEEGEREEGERTQTIWQTASLSTHAVYSTRKTPFSFFSFTSNIMGKVCD